MFKFLCVVFVATTLLLPFKDGDTVADAAKNEIVQQIPPALDILSSRHPILVGMPRALFNDHGEADSFVQSFARTYMDEQQTPGLFDSYLLYYTVLFNKDAIRTKMADSLEQQLGLG